jgi:hypothetical protein
MLFQLVKLLTSSILLRQGVAVQCGMNDVSISKGASAWRNEKRYNSRVAASLMEG